MFQLMLFLREEADRKADIRREEGAKRRQVELADKKERRREDAQRRRVELAKKEEREKLRREERAQHEGRRHAGKEEACARMQEVLMLISTIKKK